jgi:serine/threonine-protein kinase
VHRDVKPGNLLVTPEGVVKVTDFGIARAADGVPLTATGHVMGTPHYLSPEQAQGKPVTPASDVYGLGIVLFECLAGHKPFGGQSAVATALQHVNDPLPPLPDDVPSWLRSVVERATAKDPTQRFSEAGELAAVLKDGRSDDAGAAGAATALLTRASPATPAAPSPVVSRQTTTSRPDTPARRRRPWGAILAALVALVLGVLLVMALLDQTDDPADTVQVDRDDYVGRPYEEAAEDLSDAGLEPSREERDNPGGRTPETVADVRPTGQVEEGSAVILTVWGPEPEPEPEPEPKPEPKPEPEPTPEETTEPTEETEETTPTAATSESDNSGNGIDTGQGGGD